MRPNRTPEQMARLTPCRVRRFADCSEALTEMRLLAKEIDRIHATDLTPAEKLALVVGEAECRMRNVMRHAQSVLEQHGENPGRTWQESHELHCELNDLFYRMPDGPENASGR